MKYALVKTPDRDAFVALEPVGWGKSSQELFDQTYVCGYDAWLAYSHNNFSNPSQQADEQRYKDRGYWTEIFRDKIVESRRATKDGLQVFYISRAETSVEKEHKVTAPEEGWYVPDGGVLFVTDTLIPLRTVQNRDEAIKLLEHAGIPREQVSYFYRLDRYGSERFVGRVFDPGGGDYGRFYVGAGWLPSVPGNAGVGSRQVSEDIEIAFEVDARHLY